MHQDLISNTSTILLFKGNFIDIYYEETLFYTLKLSAFETKLENCEITPHDISDL